MPLSRIFSFRSKNKETNTPKNLKIAHPKPINESEYANSLAGEVVTIKLNEQSHNFIKSEKVVLTSFKPPSSQSKDEFDPILKDVENILKDFEVFLDNIDTKALGEIDS
ncbi:hypothetical protein RFEPED_0744 [Rickettsia felis str. Pedreira]|uniref:Uncharacterized protein n=2 Tax=Rickettsia felis TaxID=42862 RepID=A0A0F3MRF2_RICFI|nr:hypothetical protein [Rickettsia felis]AAY61011.1 unknown [Rickettsia felis URRWXCal2]KJV58363.1 hypothetical protein RFEPED_0744 [Rickettsia felis str. Pedreira]MDE8610834.1 hypothetical protein [Rickettsia felis]